MSKKKILLLADDLRMSSGVGTMSEDGWEGGIYTGPYYGCIHFEKEE